MGRLHSPGNQFGEEGIKTITQLMEGIGLVEVVGSFSDDEGDEDEEEEEEGEAESGEDQEGDVSAEDKKLQVNDTSISHEERPSESSEQVCYNSETHNYYGIVIAPVAVLSCRCKCDARLVH